MPLSQVGCATTCCPWRTGRIWERAADRDARSTTTASLCSEAPSLNPAATSTPRYQGSKCILGVYSFVQYIFQFQKQDFEFL